MNAVAANVIEIKAEGYSEQLCEELLPMLRKNWQASASYTEQIVFDPDLKRYKKLDELGMVFCMTARDRGRLIGYAIWYIVTSLNYAGKSGHGVAAFIEPEYSGHGLTIMRRSEAALRAQGIRRFYWFARPGSTLFALTLAMGYKPDEMVMEKTNGVSGN